MAHERNHWNWETEPGEVPHLKPFGEFRTVPEGQSGHPSIPSPTDKTRWAGCSRRRARFPSYGPRLPARSRPNR
jgi:hypothetical protein